MSIVFICLEGNVFFDFYICDFVIYSIFPFPFHQDKTRGRSCFWFCFAFLIYLFLVVVFLFWWGGGDNDILYQIGLFSFWSLASRQFLCHNKYACLLIYIMFIHANTVFAFRIISVWF